MNKLKSYTEARSTFQEQFYQGTRREGFYLSEANEDVLPAFLPVMLRLYDEKFSRLLTVERSWDTKHGFAYALRETCHGTGRDDLVLSYHQPLDNIPEITALYAMWLVDQLPAEDMEAVLQACLRSHVVRNRHEAGELQTMSCG